MKREPGYYWVKFARLWMVGRYMKTINNYYYWLIPGISEPFESKDLDEIDERRIEHEN